MLISSIEVPRAAMDQRLILHIMPSDLWRGAQTFARALLDHLNGPGARQGERHVGLTIFAGSGGPFQAEFELGMGTRLRAARFDPRVAPRLGRAIAEIDPAAIVAHGGEAMKYLAFTRKHYRPTVWYRIGVAEPYLNRRSSLILHRISIRRADLVACVSQEVADEVVKYGSTPTVVVPNGRDPAIYSVPRTPSDRCRVLYLSALTDGKRPTVFLDVVRELRARGLDLQATIVGDGPLASEVAARAAVEDVEYLGRRTDVPELLASADVFVFPGVGPEGMPGVLIEAAMAGLPIVTTAVPGASDVVVDGKTGYVVDVDDVEGVVDRVAALVADPALRDALGAGGVAWAREHFSMDRTSQVWWGVIDRLIGPPTDPTSTPRRGARGRARL